MTVADRRSALAALEAARPGLAELSASRHPDEVAADIIDIWSSVETALRSLMGGSILSGQPLIRELRTRELISLEQAHSLLELLAVRERVDRTDYQPSDADVAVAREACSELEAGLLQQPSAADRVRPLATPDGVPLATEPAGGFVTAVGEGGGGPSRGPGRVVALIVLAVVLVAAWGVYYYLAHRDALPSDVAAAVSEYSSGRPEAARAAFAAAAREHPSLALPHLYLARIAREEGDFATAGSEMKRDRKSVV